MSTNKVNGINWSLDAGKIDFFGAKGEKFDEKSWAINAFGNDLLCQVEPGSMMPEISACIASDVDSGNGDKIAQVQLGARQAVVFFLEGKLTREHLKNAVEGLGFIDIPSVAIDDRTLTVRITPSPENTVATADSEGNIL